MKKIILSILIFGCTFIHGQTNSLGLSEIVYFGLDFSKTRLKGDFGNGDGNAMKTKMFTGWNNLVLAEPNNFDLATTFSCQIVYDLEAVTRQNNKADENFIRRPEINVIDHTTLQEMVRRYEGHSNTSGTGLTFIVEMFDKDKSPATAYVHVVIFDIASRKIMYSKKMTGVAAGFGLRNFWAGAIKDILKKIRLSEFDRW
jgi:hypothetical protein